MKRSKHNLSHYHLTSFDMGELVPVGCVEVLAGDSFRHKTSAFIRVTPQLKPVMHPVSVNIAHFFVPNRILWSGWEDFITGESATPPPTISGGAHTEGMLYDYLGVYNDASNDYNALPIRAYNMIWNTFFRDQDLHGESAEDSLTVRKVCWAKDYFTAARPWAEKSLSSVTVPLGTSANVKTNAVGTETVAVVNGSGSIRDLSDPGSLSLKGTVTDTDHVLFADLANATGPDVVEFREAFAKQRYNEARARYGSRYVDYLRYLGIRPSDGRLDRPEFLGAGRTNVNFSEVLQTAEGASTPVGTLTGHGIAAMQSNRYVRFFEEHGWVISLAYVRPRSIYVNGLHKKFSRTTKEDYYQRELESVGAEEVLNKEVYAAHTTPAGVFGYSDRYSSYRSEPSRVSAEFRNATSNDWHFGRIFSSDPSLNTTFVECEPTKRVFSEQSEDSLWCMVHHSLQARRMVSKFARTRL